VVLVSDQIATAAYRGESLLFIGNLISSSRPESLFELCVITPHRQK
jgi:hypothetical protein